MKNVKVYIFSVCVLERKNYMKKGKVVDPKWEGHYYKLGEGGWTILIYIK